MAKTLWTVLWIALILLVVLAVAGMLYHNFSLRLSMAGERVFTVEYGEDYIEPGAEAYFTGKYLQAEPEAVEVECKGTVGTDIGTYLLKYIARKGNLIATAYRTVHVVDTEPPVITLVEDPEKFTFPNETYIEEGFKAWDVHDGDVTAQVVASESDGQVYYTVTDSAGNQGHAVRQIRYDDPVPPEMTLIGDSLMEVYAGTVFEDPGCTAQDNCNGDLTEAVTVAGTVDMYQPGDYTLTYSVEDGYGNAASVARTVRVHPIGDQPPMHPTGKVICLTFDDGPSAYTERLLEVLAKYNVKATFFLVNTDYAPVMEQIAQAGHALAVHTKTHWYGSIYASQDAYFRDLYGMQEVIESYTGQRPMILRFPGGSSNMISRAYRIGIMSKLTKAVEEKGFTYFDWNVDSRDAGGAKTSAEVYNNVIKGIQKHDRSVVLQHDTTAFSVNAVENIIRWGIMNGYTFEVLTPDSPECHHPVRN